MVDRADRLREEGKRMEAIGELDVLLTYDVQEVQSLARLADAVPARSAPAQAAYVLVGPGESER